MDEIDFIQPKKTVGKLISVDVLDQIRAEMAEYKDDKIIHAERNEMIDRALEIIDKYKTESEE